MYTLEKYLDDLEKRIDPIQEDAFLDSNKKFCYGNWDEVFFMPKRLKISPSKLDWPKININDALEDYELMLIKEFEKCSEFLSIGSGDALWVRSNYGIGIMPSLFGAEKFIMPYDLDTLPNCRHLKNGKDDIKRILDSGDINLYGGWGENVFRIGGYLKEIQQKYPKIAKYIYVDHPDCQGPMDICEILWGSDIFIDLYDETELVHSFLRKITDTYKAFLDKWFNLFPKKDIHNYLGVFHKGSFTLRDDSAMNLSPEMYAEFILPYNNELLEYFNGGAIHSCGRVEHFVPNLSKMKSLYAFNISQPELNDMEIIYQNTIDKGISLVGLNHQTVQAAINEKRKLHGLVSSRWK